MIIAVCGLAGAGKTTTLDILERRGAGAKVYVGSFVTAEVVRRGLEATSENERLVREELRASSGMAAMAQQAFPTIEGILNAGRVALVDAIYCVEEYEFYREHCSDRVIRIAVKAAKHERERRPSTLTHSTGVTSSNLVSWV
jgi:dephospho-CoA kinase